MSIWGDDPSVRQDRDYAIQKYADDLPEIKLSRLVEICDTWDILLFSGNAPFSVAEEFVTNSVFSHVATIYKDPISKKCYNWESTMADETIDVLTGTHKTGPRLIEIWSSMFEYIDSGGNFIVYRKLFTPMNEKSGTGGPRRGYTKEKYKEMVQWMKMQSEKTYEEKLWELPAAYWKRKLYPRGPDPSSYFCSELVAETWKMAGIPLHRHSDLYCPQDFSQRDEALWDTSDKAKGYSLSREYKLILE